MHFRDKCRDSSLCEERRLGEKGTWTQHPIGEAEEKDSKVVLGNAGRTWTTCLGAQASAEQ